MGTALTGEVQRQKVKMGWGWQSELRVRPGAWGPCREEGHCRVMRRADAQELDVRSALQIGHKTVSGDNSYYGQGPQFTFFKGLGLKFPKNLRGLNGLQVKKFLMSKWHIFGRPVPNPFSSQIYSSKTISQLRFSGKAFNKWQTLVSEDEFKSKDQIRDISRIVWMKKRPHPKPDKPRGGLNSGLTNSETESNLTGWSDIETS